MATSKENQEPTVSKEENHDSEELSLVLIHRLPISNLPIRDRLTPHFRVLDPYVDSPLEPLKSFLSVHASYVRALVCVGPTPLTSETLNLLPCLEVVVGTSAGVDKIDILECRRRGIVVTNASSAFKEDTADYAVVLLVDVLRRISAGDRYVRGGCWPVRGDYHPLGFKLGGKRVGIVGLGSIGYEVAKRLLAFGCLIAYHSRKKKSSVPFPFYDNVCDLARDSDVLVVCCSLTEQTRHIINKDVLTALGEDGVVINIGRGALIDEKELVQFLVQGKLRGAGLDVFENEPNVPKELFALDNVVLSPHRAVLTPEALRGVEDLVCSNLHAFFSNKPLQSIVHME